MSEEQVQQKAVKSRFSISKENRGPIALITGIVCASTLAAGGAWYVLAPKSVSSVSTGGINASNVRPDAAATTSDAYKEAVREQNKEKYEAAQSKVGGVAMPFTFDDEPKGEPVKDIKECGCTFDDEQLLAAMKRLGVMDGVTTKDNMRVGESDIYLSHQGQLMGEDQLPLRFRDLPIFMESNGLLVDEKGVAVLTKNKEPIYLGKKGEIIDAKARVIPLLGDLLTSPGVVIMDDGRQANRPGNMQRVASSDIYVTKDGQLVTMDAKPIRNTGSFVYRDDEQKLISRTGADLAWENQSVFQNKLGRLVGISGQKFRTPGILFSFEGILIDNDGLLTKPLVNIQRVGITDIYRTESGSLVDQYARPLKHYGKKVVSSKISGVLRAGISTVKNRRGSDIYLYPKGPLKVDVGQGGVQSGAIKTTDGVAYDRLGMLLTRRGRLERRGSSEIFTTGDGLLTDILGKPMQYKKKDIFLDFNTFLEDGSQALETYDHEKVLSDEDQRLYLTLDGKLVDHNKQLVKEVGVITSFDGVLVTSGGKKIISKDGVEQVVTKNGSPVQYNGKPVFKGEDGRLLDADGNPILTADGRAVFMDPEGNLIDENGRLVPASEIALTAGGRKVKNGEFATRREVSGSNGEPLFHKGKQAYIDSHGRLVDEKGNIILTSDGREVYLNESGQVVDKNGNVIEESILRTQAGSVVKSGISSGIEQITTKDGEAVKYQGQNVYRSAQGHLVDINGQPILSKDGRKLFLNQKGEIVDRDGNKVDDVRLFTNGKRIKNGDLKAIPSGEIKQVGQSDIYVSRDGLLVDSSGKAISYKGKKVRVNKKGQLIDEDGKPVLDLNGQSVFINSSGELVDSSGRSLKGDFLKNGDGVVISSSGRTVEKDIQRVGNSDLFKSKNGALVDSKGKGLLYKGKSVFIGKDGKLYDENMNLVKDSKGNAVYLDPETGEFVDRNGNRIHDNLLTNYDGVLVDSKGELITSGGKLTKIPNTEYYKAENGQLVNKDGMPILQDGKPIFLGDNNQLINRFGKAIRFRGQETYIGSDGEIISQSGNPIKDTEGNALQLTESGIANSNGELINQKTGKPLNQSGNNTNSNISSGFQSHVQKEQSTHNVDRVNKKSEKPSRSSQDPKNNPELNQVQSQPEANVALVKEKGHSEIELLDQKSSHRLQRRYMKIKESSRAWLSEARSLAQVTPNQGYLAVGGTGQQSLREGLSPDSQLKSEKGTGKTQTEEVLQRAGSMMYAITTYQINSDFSDNVVVDLVGLPQSHPLYGAKAMGTANRKYEHLVLKFNKVCPKEQACLAMNGIALDPSTSAAGLASNVDNHYWYRFGGLFLSLLLEGSSDAMDHAGTREEKTTNTGTRTTDFNLDGDKLIIKSLGKVGKGFADIFAQNVNRPATVWIEPGEEMAILLFDNISKTK